MSLKDTADLLELRSSLKMMIELVKQSEFFFDRGTRFEQTVARQMLVQKTLEAEALIKRIDSRTKESVKGESNE